MSFLNICSKYSSMKFRAKRLLETCMCQVFKICNLCNTCLKILSFPAKRLRKNTALKIRMRQFFKKNFLSIIVLSIKLSFIRLSSLSTIIKQIHKVYSMSFYYSIHYHKLIIQQKNFVYIYQDFWRENLGEFAQRFPQQLFSENSKSPLTYFPPKIALNPLVQNLKR